MSPTKSQSYLAGDLKTGQPSKGWGGFFGKPFVCICVFLVVLVPRG